MASLKKKKIYFHRYSTPIVDFIKPSGVLMEMCYEIYVDRIESAPIDLLFLDWLQHY